MALIARVVPAVVVSVRVVRVVKVAKVAVRVVGEVMAAKVVLAVAVAMAAVMMEGGGMGRAAAGWSAAARVAALATAVALHHKLGIVVL